MNAFTQFQTEDRRLMILRLLAEIPGYAANEYVLRAALGDYGHAVSADRLRGDLAWLTEQELLRLETPAGLTVAHLLPRGQDVGAGHAQAPGVARPRPGA